MNVSHQTIVLTGQEPKEKKTDGTKYCPNSWTSFSVFAIYFASAIAIVIGLFHVTIWA